jgi:dihydrofolate reductase
VASLEEAFDLAEVEILRSAQNDKKPSQNDKEPSQNDKHNVMSSEVETSASRVFVIGGGQIYAQAISQVDSMVITHVHTVIEDADTFFPAIDPAVWTVAERSELQTDPETGYTFEFVKYVKR